MGARLARLIKKLRQSYLFWSVMRETNRKIDQARKSNKRKRDRDAE